MTNSSIQEASLSALAYVDAKPRIPEASLSALVTVNSVPKIQEAWVSALCYIGSCASQRCDLWYIQRTDGMIFAFTSLDAPFTFRGVTFQPCASLQDSASTMSSDVGSVGSVQFVGLLSDDAISEADLYGGLYDDAYVECWLVSWGEDNDPATPTRTAAGWMGQISRGQNTWTAEVAGPSSRLQQTALVEFYQPGCRWTFGTSPCPVVKSAYALNGIVATGGLQRYGVQFDPVAGVGAAIYNQGQVVWDYGPNAGIVCQINTADLANGVISLWDLAPFPIQAGDTFNILPGCPKDKPSCLIYGAYNFFGGFPDVPGPDSLQQNADALFTA